MDEQDRLSLKISRKIKCTIINILYSFLPTYTNMKNQYVKENGKLWIVGPSCVDPFG